MNWLKMPSDTINPFDMNNLCNESNRMDLKTILRGYGSLFELLPENLRNDRDIVKSALVSSGLAFNFVSKEIAEDREMVEWYFENGNTDFRYISDKFRKDKGMIMKYSTKWSDADISLLQDKEVAMHYCRKNQIPN
ncbi:predicted protein [Naegleria gruberi]|uniref:Predicted protein n=1 Tax=Naegleria gruberi TaxID=5762 RepID=D2VLY8_NAEGR|nr:uncharacterized protein NAEGRDRAFT_69947 [Naegleria gruberi]EFC42137.1 predicted protein [Naegleria gruberi]|eukprot:XP_002674881.1 predicted protein [Naegleria gruberi strain NEG-M]